MGMTYYDVCIKSNHLKFPLAMDLIRKYLLNCHCTEEFLASPLWVKVLAVIGALVITGLVLRLFKFFWSNYIAGGKVGYF